MQKEQGQNRAGGRHQQGSTSGRPKPAPEQQQRQAAVLTHTRQGALHPTWRHRRRGSAPGPLPAPPPACSAHARSSWATVVGGPRGGGLGGRVGSWQCSLAPVLKRAEPQAAPTAEAQQRQPGSTAVAPTGLTASTAGTAHLLVLNEDSRKAGSGIAPHRPLHIHCIAVPAGAGTGGGQQQAALVGSVSSAAVLAAADHRMPRTPLAGNSAAPGSAPATQG